MKFQSEIDKLLQEQHDDLIGLTYENDEMDEYLDDECLHEGWEDVCGDCGSELGDV